MVSETLILRKLSELEEYYKQIGELSSTTVNEYQRDWKLQRIVERTLQMMIETCSDIAGHIISDRKLRVPTSYADAFAVLHENNMISAALFEAMQKMAKFRNVVVHHYDSVDAEIVIEILKKHLLDFISFKEAIVMALQADKAAEE